jgi:LacI family transcriptional regulator
MKNRDRRPTLSDVAELAGVSLGSASRALSVPHLVKPNTLERVNAAVAKLGYVRNGAAQALASKKTHVIAAIYPTLSNPVFANSIHSVQQTLWARGYQLLVASHEYDAAREFTSIKAIVERGIDGIILVGTDHDRKVFELLEQHYLPYVLMWSLDGTDYPHCVGISNYKAAYDMARLVMEKGHTRIAYCGGVRQNNERARTRLQGTQDALAEAGLAMPPRWIMEQPFTFDGGRSAVQRLCSSPDHPTALICGTDVQAIGAVFECQAQGIAVPSQLSITGFDDIEFARFTIPPLTTVKVPIEEIGVRAAEKIVSLIDHQLLPQESPFVGICVQRGTLGTVPHPTVL